MRTIREEKMARDLNLFPGIMARDAAHIARAKAKAQQVDEEIRRQQVAAAAAVIQAQKATEREQEGNRFLLGAVGVCLAVIVALAVRLGMGM